MSIATDSLRSFARRIETIDDEIRERNDGKKQIYAELKSLGFDSKAFKIAHRKCVAQRDDPQATEELDSIVDLYLEVLSGRAPQESSVDPVSAPANGLPDIPSRTRTKATATRFRMEDTAALSQAAADAGFVSRESAEETARIAQAFNNKFGDGQPLEPDAGDIPQFLRRA